MRTLAWTGCPWDAAGTTHCSLIGHRVPIGPPPRSVAALGVAIIGGLALSQLLTLFTTPVIYLYFDRLAVRLTGRWPANPLAGHEPAE